MNLPHLLAAILVAAFLAAPPARAAGDHDHGDAAPSAVGEALPRFTAESELFELVGVLSGQQITLYLDRYADNNPVRDAQIELEISGAKFKAEAHGDGEYEVLLPEAPKPGVLPITATVTAGNEADLLAGELDIHEEAHADEAEHAHSLKEYALWATAGFAVLALLGWAARRMLGARGVRAGGAA
ncbi:hypothetical protein [Methylibium sp. Root1272]|jgi:hypothetical protein|uniref:hypothetical protein n=1 Tax=Methylibium sp. Root1272 TaxID=1736441 RepID=UPI0006F2C0DA|nr:hypothetical protein [Methylibium sp. Root1272]KQW76433.1 hypothetical protein ASC67_01885 [Methylibium sp. Root1272]